MNAVNASKIVKTYRIRVGRARVREMMPWPMDATIRRLFPRWWARDTFNALDDVSLTIPGGASIGVVGHNGAGKTTLLKIIAGVTQPSGGHVTVSGRIGALIDLIVGFNPDLTGRENAYLLASMHGFGRRSVGPRIERILDYAEIEGGLVDTPVKRYSAGMISRLGFAVVTALDADILLVDEVLVVGDASFQQKCIRWLEEYRRQGGTLVFVSHNLSLVRSMTEHTIWLDKGRLVDQGATAAVLARYAKSMEHRDDTGERGTPLGSDRDKWRSAHRTMTTQGLQRWGTGGARVQEVHVNESASNATGVEIDISYGAEASQRAVFCVGFMDEGGKEVGSATSPSVTIPEGDGVIRCNITPMPLRPGIYFPVLGIVTDDGVIRDRWKLERAIVVDGRPGLGQDGFGPVEIAANWWIGEPAQ